MEVPLNMKSSEISINFKKKKQSGNVIVVTAIFLLLFIGIAALAVDVGRLFTTRNELQNIADAAALAGARYIGDEYSKLEPSAIPNKTFTKEEIWNVIEAVAYQNKAANSSISIDIDDVLIGFWDAKVSVEDIIDEDGNVGVETLLAPDAVRVIARRDSNANNPITTIFAQIFGMDSISVTSLKAIAALSGPVNVGPGEMNCPFGLSQKVFEGKSPDEVCIEVIAFSPTTDSCAGWHNFFDSMNADAAAEKLIGLIQGDNYIDPDLSDGELSNGADWLEANFDINKTPDPDVTPPVSEGDEFEFQGGTISSLFLGGYLGNDYNGNSGTVYDNEKKPAPMIALFDYFRFRDGDGDDSQWTARVPVYKDTGDSCINPTGSIEIVGFADIVIFSPDPPPLSSLKVHVSCDFNVIEGRGGGSNLGNLKGAIPTLVK